MFFFWYMIHMTLITLNVCNDKSIDLRLNNKRKGMVSFYKPSLLPAKKAYLCNSMTTYYTGNLWNSNIGPWYIDYLPYRGIYKGIISVKYTDEVSFTNQLDFILYNNNMKFLAVVLAIILVFQFADVTAKNVPSNDHEEAYGEQQNIGKS